MLLKSVQMIWSNVTYMYAKNCKLYAEHTLFTLSTTCAIIHLLIYYQNQAFIQDFTAGGGGGGLNGLKVILA